MPIQQPNIVARFAQGVQTGNALQQIRDQRADRQRASQGRNALSDLLTGGQTPNAMSQLAQADPATAMEFQKFQTDQQQAQREAQARQAAENALTVRQALQTGNVPLAAQTIQQMPDSPQKQQALQLLAQGDTGTVAQMADGIIDTATRMGVLEAGPSQPAKVKEYLFARGQGYTGSIQDWLAEQDSGMSLSVDPEGGVSFTTGRGSGLKPVGGTESRNLRDAEVATRNFVNTAGDALQLLQENPDINTAMGKAAGIVNNLQQEAGAFARGIGLEFDTSTLDPSKHKETFDRLGIDNARMQSLITSMAFQAAAASGQTGRSVSDRDVRRFIEEIGASSADPRAFSQVLNDLAGRTVRNFKTNLAVRTGREIEDDLGVSQLPQIGEQQQEAPLYDDETEALIRKYTEEQ